MKVRLVSVVAVGGRDVGLSVEPEQVDHQAV